MELILGTAEFGTVPYGEGVKKPPTLKEVAAILHLAYEAGIRTLDTADTYMYSPEVAHLLGFFPQIKKTRNLEKVFQKGWFYHYRPGESAITAENASIYDPEQITSHLNTVVVPMSLNNTAFIEMTPGIKTYARSVFDRGRLLKDGFSIKDCLAFVKAQDIDGIIVGVNSAKELKKILDNF